MIGSRTLPILHSWDTLIHDRHAPGKLLVGSRCESECRDAHIHFSVKGKTSQLLKAQVDAQAHTRILIEVQ